MQARPVILVSQRLQVVEWDYPYVFLPDHSYEQVFVAAFFIATVERVSGKGVGVRQIQRSPGDWLVRWQRTLSNSRSGGWLFWLPDPRFQESAKPPGSGNFVENLQ